LLVPLRDDAHEMRLRAAYVLDRLTRLWPRQEAYKIAGMARPQGDADLAVVLHAADAGAVTRARIEHNDGPLAGIDRDIRRRLDTHEDVIDGFRQDAPVYKQFAVETEHMRGRSRAPRAINVSALAQDVEKENGAFERVSPVVEKGASEGVLLEHDGLQ